MRSSSSSRCRWSAPTWRPAVDALRGRSRAAPADGVGGEGRWTAAPPAGARGCRRRARAAAGTRRSFRGRRRSSRGRTRRPPCWSSAGAARTCARSRPISVSRSEVARTSHRSVACRSAPSPWPSRTRSTTSSPIPTPRCSLSRPRCAISNGSTSTTSRSAPCATASPFRPARSASAATGRSRWSHRVTSSSPCTNGAARRANLQW